MSTVRAISPAASFIRNHKAELAITGVAMLGKMAGPAHRVLRDYKGSPKEVFNEELLREASMLTLTGAAIFASLVILKRTNVISSLAKMFTGKANPGETAETIIKSAIAIPGFFAAEFISRLIGEPPEWDEINGQSEIIVDPKLIPDAFKDPNNVRVEIDPDDGEVQLELKDGVPLPPLRSEAAPLKTIPSPNGNLSRAAFAGLPLVPAGYAQQPTKALQFTNSLDVTAFSGQNTPTPVFASSSHTSDQPTTGSWIG